jgi:lipoprotein-anchoring transpeptidase ErfK/SrfK
MSPDQELNKATETNSFWQDRGEREFVFILLLSLLIIGVILWFLFSTTGNQMAQNGLKYIGDKSIASVEYLGNTYYDLMDKKSYLFKVEADDKGEDENAFDQSEIEEIEILNFRDIRVNQLKPYLVKNKKLSLDKITNSVYYKKEQDKRSAIASGKPVYTKGKYLDVNLSSQSMTLYKDGANKGSYLISSGSSRYPTPTGEHQISSKAIKAFSAAYDLYMPYWMAFIGSSYGVHELPETASGIKEGASSLGVPVSHGCIRLGVGAAERVYNFTPIGTRIVIH